MNGVGMEGGDNKKKNERKLVDAMDEKTHLDFDNWYIKNYKETIGLKEAVKKYKKNKIWVAANLENIKIGYSSIWRNHILMMLNSSTFPKKIEYITTVFNLQRKNQNINYGMMYTWMDDHKKFQNEYIAIGPTYKSADGEYRARFIPYNQIMDFINNNRKHFDKFVKHCEDNKLQFKATSFFPDKVHKKFAKRIDELSLPQIVYFCTWLFDVYYYDLKIISNHIAENYIAVIVGPGDVEFYKELISNWKHYFSHIIMLSELQSKKVSAQKFVDITCGQKIIPLHVKEIEQIGDIRYKTWRELYIGKLVGDLTINGISPSFPILANWFLICANQVELYDNEITHIKFEHSEIAKEIIVKLENARRNTFEEKSGREIYFSSNLETLSESIDYSIVYSEKEIMLSDYSLCILNEYAGFTMADFIQNDRKKHKITIMQTGYIFTDHLMFSKYMFEYIYGFYCMNLHIGLIHADTHLNNVTLHTLHKYYDHFNSRMFISDSYILYDLTETGDDLYMFPHHGKYAVIIDFSRGLLNGEKLYKVYPEEKVDEYIGMQRRRIVKLWMSEFPDFMGDKEHLLEAALFRDFDATFKLFSAYDSYKLCTSMKNVLLAEALNIRPESMKLLDDVISLSGEILTVGAMNLLNGKTTEIGEFPNLTILKKCFSHGHISQYKERSLSELSIVDYFNATNKIQYSTSEPEKFPKSIKYDEIVKADFPIVKDLVYHRYNRMEKYLATHDIQKNVADISNEVREEEYLRRGYKNKKKEIIKKQEIQNLADVIKIAL